MHTQGQGREYRRKPRGIAVAQWHAPLRWRRAASRPQLVGPGAADPTPRCPQDLRGIRASSRARLQRRAGAVSIHRARTGGPHVLWTHAAVAGDGPGERRRTERARRGRQVEAATVVRTGPVGGPRGGETADHVTSLAPPAWQAAAVSPPPPLPCTARDPRLERFRTV